MVYGTYYIRNAQVASASSNKVKGASPKTKSNQPLTSHSMWHWFKYKSVHQGGGVKSHAYCGTMCVMLLNPKYTLLDKVVQHFNVK